jgi:hypothetical protein
MSGEAICEIEEMLITFTLPAMTCLAFQMLPQQGLLHRECSWTRSEDTPSLWSRGVGRSSVSTVYWGTLCGEEKTFFRGYGIIERRFSKTSLNGVDRAQYSSAANPPPGPFFRRVQYV